MEATIFLHKLEKYATERERTSTGIFLSETTEKCP